ncbi:MAG: hypothetical protein HRT38_15750 [Alteromonadaceae bacterium]|nr:hypothetical protein [Alteromonadaceae bacterium]
MDDLDTEIDDFFNKIEAKYQLPLLLKRERMEIRMQLRNILDLIPRQQ